MITDVLIEKIKQTENPSVIGFDPRLSYVPEFIKNESFSKFEETLKGAANALYKWGTMLIDELYDIIPAIKPQVAMYEMFGSEGIDAFIKTVEYAKSKGLIVIGDIKRSDIGSTAESYSEGHVGCVSVGSKSYSVYKEDMITINPYLGVDTIEPFLNDCVKYEKGMFILVKTSNPNSGQLQDLLVEGAPVYEHVGKLVRKWGEEHIGDCGYSLVGAVVGATHTEQAKRLRELMPSTMFLVPGYGAQGATAQDLACCFDKEGLGAIVNSSRGVIAAFQKEKYKQFGEESFHKAARQAALDMKEDLNAVRGGN